MTCMRFPAPFLCLVPLFFSWPLVVLLCSTPLWTSSHFSAAFPLPPPLVASITVTPTGDGAPIVRKLFRLAPPIHNSLSRREREGSSIFPVCFVFRDVLFVMSIIVQNVILLILIFNS